MREPEQLLARLFGRRAARFKWSMGRVTSVSPLRVLPEGSTEDVGPLALVRSAPELDADVPLVWIDSAKQWAVIGAIAGGAEFVAMWGQQIAGAPFDPMHAIRYVLHKGGAWDPSSSAIFAERGGGVFVEFSRAEPNDHEDVAQMSEPSYIADQPLGFPTRLVVKRFPHIFRMSDGALIVIAGTSVTSFQSYWLRSPSGTWSGPTALPAPGSTATSWCRNGDTLYGHGSATMFRLAYSAGVITADSEAMSDGSAPAGIYYDTENDLIHVWRDTSFSDTVAAVRPNTLDVLFTSSAIPLDFGGGDSGGSMLVGNGGASFLAWTYRSQYRAYALTAGPSSYSVGAREDVPTLPADAKQCSVLADGTDYVIVGSTTPSAVNYYACRRTAPNTYSTWVLLGSDSGSGHPQLARPGAGGRVRFAYLYQVNSGAASTTPAKLQEDVLTIA